MASPAYLLASTVRTRGRISRLACGRHLKNHEPKSFFALARLRIEPVDFMFRDSCRILTVSLLLAGCSSSGIFSRRDLHEPADVDVASSPEQAATLATAGSRFDDSPKAGAPGKPAAGSRAAVDPKLRRPIAEALAAGRKHETQGNLAAARVDYERVLELDPRNTFAHYQLALMADNEGRFADAERHYLVVVDHTPDNPDLLSSLGWSYLLQGRYADSERVLRDALHIDPRHRTALYNLGWLYGKRGFYDESLAILRSAGSEADAQQALAKLFPQGRPRPDHASDADAPREAAGAPQIRAGTSPSLGDSVTAVVDPDNSGSPMIRPVSGEIASRRSLAAEKSPPGLLPPNIDGPPAWPSRATAPAHGTSAAAQAVAAKWGLFLGPGGTLFPPTQGGAVSQ